MKKHLAVYGLAATLVIAGIAHFVRPEVFVRIVPRWVPDADAAVLWSGVAEVVLGTAVLIKRTRYLAAFGIIGLLIVVFPANVRMANDWVQGGHPVAWIAIARLPLQALLILWAWKVRRL